MYRKQRYTKEDPKYIFEFIRDHPFSTFVMQGERLLATHIPVLTEGDAWNFRLFAHISKEYNEQIRLLEDGREALLIFHGPQAYISSSWYRRKNISSWDYSAVHINVRLKVQSKEELENSLKKLVRHFEDKQEKPLYYDEIPRKMIEGQLPYITGFWCEPFNIEAVAKLHQGYRDEDIHSVIDHLGKKDDPLARQLGEDIRREHSE